MLSDGRKADCANLGLSVWRSEQTDYFLAQKSGVMAGLWNKVKLTPHTQLFYRNESMASWSGETQERSLSEQAFCRVPLRSETCWCLAKHTKGCRTYSVQGFLIVSGIICSDPEPGSPINRQPGAHNFGAWCLAEVTVSTLNILKSPVGFLCVC